MLAKQKRLIVLIGPTAVGKTGMAIRLAKHWKTEIVSADSRQIYREMEIGTAKPSPELLNLVPHHLINTHSVSENYDAGQYGRDALVIIYRLLGGHDKVIMTGGSGLYIKAVCEGFDDLPDIPSGVREKIIQDYNKNGIGWLQEQVKAKDSSFFSKVDQKNPQRLIRALELLTTGTTIDVLRNQKKIEHSFDIIKVGLNLDRDLLYKHIDQRVDEMVSFGLVEEAKRLHPLQHLNALQTVGYAEIFGYLDGRYDLAEAIRLIKRNTRNYAKRQLTWFRRDRDIAWFTIDQHDEIIHYCENWRPIKLADNPGTR